MLTWKAHQKRVHSLAYSPDGEFLASAGADGDVVLWDRASGKAARRFKDPQRDMRLVFFLRGGTCLAAVNAVNGQVFFWDMQSKEERKKVLANRAFECAAVSPDEMYLASGGRRKLELRALEKGGKDKGPFWHQQSIWGVAFSPDGRVLATGSEDKTARLWDIAEGKCLTVLKPQKTVRQVAFSPDGKYLAAVVGWHSVRLWGLPAARGGPILQGHNKAIHALAFSPDSCRLVTGGFDRIVKLWDVASGTEQTSFDWKIGQVRSLAFAPDGMTAAAGGENGKIVIWDID